MCQQKLGKVVGFDPRWDQGGTKVGPRWVLTQVVRSWLLARWNQGGTKVGPRWNQGGTKVGLNTGGQIYKVLMVGVGST